MSWVCFRLAWTEPSRVGAVVSSYYGYLGASFLSTIIFLISVNVRKSVWVCVCVVVIVCSIFACYCATILSDSRPAFFFFCFFYFFPPLLQPFSLIFICFSFNLFCHFVFLSAVIVVVAIFIAFITNTHTDTDIYIYVYTLTHVASSNIVCPSQPQCVSSLYLCVCVCGRVCACVCASVSICV